MHLYSQHCTYFGGTDYIGNKLQKEGENEGEGKGKEREKGLKKKIYKSGQGLLVFKCFNVLILFTKA